MTYIIIGSGIAGVNAAMTLLERGKQVEIWDADLADPSYLNKSNVPESYYGENLKGSELRPIIFQENEDGEYIYIDISFFRLKKSD